MNDINLIAENIISRRTPCLFVSPHLDDAVFSAGNLLLRLAFKTRITLATVFTEASSPPYTLSAKVFLKKSGDCENASDLFRRRRSEDIMACKALKMDPVHLGLIDASFRKKNGKPGIIRILSDFIPEINHVYPVYKLHVVSGKIARQDRDNLKEAERKLGELGKSLGPCAVFCPVGIGEHIDHIIVRDICRKVFSNLILWEDFPYNTENAGKKKIDSLEKLGILKVRDGGYGKYRIMSFYESQIKHIAPEKTVSVPEIYYAAKGRADKF